MNRRHTILIAKYSARYSVRGGIGLVFLLLSLTFGLLVAHTMLQPVEMGAIEIAKHSRSGDKHRDRALALGVNRYLGKPYQEDALLAVVEELLTASATIR